MMTSRERLMAVLTGKTPDRIPFSPLLGEYFLNSLEEQGISLEDIAPSSKANTPVLRMRKNLWRMEIHKYIGSDCMLRHCKPYKVIYNNCEEINETIDNVIYTGFKTPIGNITSERQLSGDTNIGEFGYIRKKLIQTPEDMKILKYVMDNAVAIADYDPFIELDNYLGDDGIVTITGPVTPIQRLLQFDMGLEKFTYALMDYQDEMEELFEAIHNLNKQIYEIYAKSPAKVVITYEDTSTTVLSPSWFEDYCLNELNEYADILHKEDKIFITHMCGKIANLTDLISKGKQDGIDSVCPPTTGDLEPGDALKEIKKVILGGLEPPALIRMTEEETIEYTIEKLKQVGCGKDFILSTGDTTSANTPIENLIAISNLVKKVGEYPLKIEESVKVL